MKKIVKTKKVPKQYKFDIDHNPYEVLSYNTLSRNGKVIIFPIFHYEGSDQYKDLLAPIIDKGYHVITINFLSKADRVLFFNYYANVFKRLLNEFIQTKIIKNEQIIFMGFGVGALLACYMQSLKLKGITKFILLSPVNTYKDEFMISREIENFRIPTFIFYGQYDKVTNPNNRYAIFENGHKNPKVTFTCYPITGHFLYYESSLSNQVEELNRKGGYDMLVGESGQTRNCYLPEEVKYNEKFYNDLFLVLEDEPLPKRIALLSDSFPLYVSGVLMVINLLRSELEKLGYETYIVALWDKKEPIEKLPPHHIPVLASSAKFVKGHKDLHLLKSFAFQKNAKMLSLFGFDYLHLHTEYSMSQIGLLLSKYTGVKMVYTYHTLWKLYYEKKFGKVAGDATYTIAKEFLFSKVYKECPVIIVPSKKTYNALLGDSGVKDLHIIPSAIDQTRFKMNKADLDEVKKLKEKYKLKNKKVLGYVGRVSNEKNIAETLENISRIKDEIPNIVFMVVGGGDALKNLKKTIKKLNIEDNVIFVGEVENSKLKLYYSLFDVFVTASNFETQGLTYFEAACNGTLILAKKDEAIEGIFEDGKNAYIYSDFYQWVERIEKALFSNNKKIIEEAKKTMQRFTPDKWAKQNLSIYQEINKKK